MGCGLLASPKMPALFTILQFPQQEIESWDKTDVHVKFAICLHSVCNKNLPALGLADIYPDEDDFSTSLGDLLMGRKLFALTIRSKVSANKMGAFQKESIANFSANPLR